MRAFAQGATISAMVIVEQAAGWTYVAHPLSAPASSLSPFEDAVSMWRSMAPDGELPRKRDFQALDFRKWFGWVIIYEVQRERFDLRFRLFGSELASKLRLDNTGKLFSEAYAHVPGHTVTLNYFEHLWRNRMVGMSCGPMKWENMAFSTGLFLDLPVANDNGELAYFFTFARLGDQSLVAQAPLIAQLQPLEAQPAAHSAMASTPGQPATLPVPSENRPTLSWDIGSA